jgi:hypothetical protein
MIIPPVGSFSSAGGLLFFGGIIHPVVSFSSAGGLLVFEDIISQ